jgi:phosphoribosylformylglycinamidine synthase
VAPPCASRTIRVHAASDRTVARRSVGTLATVQLAARRSALPPHQGAPVGRVVVDVMPKPEILDPQGKAVASALPRLGFTGFTGVRQGRRFELTVDGPVTDEVLAQAHEAAVTLLSNPVIEDVVRVAEVAEQPADDPEAQAPAEAEA